jgi:hypothetical protein
VTDSLLRGRRTGGEGRNDQQRDFAVEINGHRPSLKTAIIYQFRDLGCKM